MDSLSSDFNNSSTFQQFNGKYSWIADLVWRNRTFKNLYVFYDQIIGLFGFSKSKNEEPIFTSKTDEFVLKGKYFFKFFSKIS